MFAKVKIGIVGIGMVGTPLMRWFSERGFQRGKNLFCYDRFRKEFSDDVSAADIIFISVPTPSGPDGSCDISIVESVVRRFSGLDKVLVLKSTVPPGTCEDLSVKYGINFFLFNPEYLTEAQAWEDFVRPDRQIVAPVNKDSARFCGLLLNLLPTAFFSSPGVEGTYDFYSATATEAELAKYGGNIFGAVKVTFANILADFCAALGGDYDNVRRLIANDRRIGGAWMDISQGNYRGFGGFCFPKDMSAFMLFAEKFIARLDEGDERREILTKGLNVFKAVWDYNKALLARQGLTIKDVSIHDAELKNKLKGEEDA